MYHSLFHALVVEAVSAAIDTFGNTGFQIEFEAFLKVLAFCLHNVKLYIKKKKKKVGVHWLVHCSCAQ